MSAIELHHLNEPLAQFRAALESGGLYGALQYLNARTTYRYTAIYRLDGQVMRNIALYDREGENPAILSEVPLGDSFCQFVLRDQVFGTDDSASDKRLDGHPYQGVVNSYFGLPLARKPGALYGTFCHFDFAPKVIADSEIALLEAAGAVLIEHLA